MKNENLALVFNSQFKFENNQEVRHKGDNKTAYANDLGLLVLKRQLEECLSDDGEVFFNRQYICRMIRFSGSGDLACFKENELMSIQEFNDRKLLEEQEVQDAREDMKRIQQKVYKLFGVKKSQEVYLKHNGTIDKENVYIVSGFERTASETRLSVRLEDGVSELKSTTVSLGEFEIKND